jgi:phage head maturation protease
MYLVIQLHYRLLNIQIILNPAYNQPQLSCVASTGEREKRRQKRKEIK